MTQPAITSTPKSELLYRYPVFRRLLDVGVLNLRPADPAPVGTAAEGVAKQQTLWEPLQRVSLICFAVGLGAVGAASCRDKVLKIITRVVNRGWKPLLRERTLIVLRHPVATNIAPTTDAMTLAWSFAQPDSTATP